jgi:hypothetical protein
MMDNDIIYLWLDGAYETFFFLLAGKGDAITLYNHL